MGVAIVVALKVSSALMVSDKTTLQGIYEDAIRCLIYGPPELEAKALKKVREIVDFFVEYRFLMDFDIDDR